MQTAARPCERCSVLCVERDDITRSHLVVSNAKSIRSAANLSNFCRRASR